MSTKIEWVKNDDGTPGKAWNPVTGCSPVSEGCQNCYARRMANRLKGRYGYPKDEPFRVTFHPDRLDEPLRWKKPSRIFVCSMGDIAHEKVDCRWFDCIMEEIHDNPQHIFLFLTKRIKNLKDLLGSWKIENFKNLWLGVSVENQQTADKRIPILLQIPAAKRFVSVEPMLEAVVLSHYIPAPVGLVPKWQTLNWVICGGETGPGFRPEGLQGYAKFTLWARSLRDQCRAAGVPFFFKKMPGGNQPIPKDLLIREFPV